MAEQKAPYDVSLVCNKMEKKYHLHRQLYVTPKLWRDVETVFLVCVPLPPPPSPLLPSFIYTLKAAHIFPLGKDATKKSKSINSLLLFIFFHFSL